MKTFSFDEIGLDKTIILSDNIKSLNNFNSFNLLNAFWINCWKITDLDNRYLFILWTKNIIVSFLFACLCGGLVDKEYSVWKIICQILLTLFACAFSLISYGSFVNTNSLIPLLILIYLLVLFNTNNVNDKSLFLFFSLIAFVAVNYTITFFLLILLWIVTIFYFVKHGISPLGSGVILLVPIFLMIGAWLNHLSQVIFIIFCFITLTMPFVILVLNKNKNLNFAYISLNNWILKHNHFISYFAITVISLALIIANIFIFNDMYHWKMPQEKYHLFFAFHISVLGNFQVSILFLLIINICLFALYLGATIFYFIVRKKNSNVYSEEAFAILVITFVVFCNFLSAHLFNTFFNELVLTYVNYIPLMAIIAFLYKTIYNVNQHISLWKYDWY